MPYINSDGSVSSQPPLLKRVQNAFWGFVDFITIFFRTLLPLPPSGSGQSASSGNRRSGNGGPPSPPNRRMGGFKTLSDCRSPMPGGG